MPKRATQVKLSEREQEELVQITRRHRSEQQQVLRAHIVLAAAQGHSNAQIAHELAINVDTARLWRDRWENCKALTRKRSASQSVCKMRPDQEPQRGLLSNNAVRLPLWHVKRR